jgi:coenzyme F420-reducing hydrogenase delta subunit
MRLSYPTNIKIVKLPCTGKIDVIYLLKAFQSGADGVYVAGCMEGDCHYLTGNLRARKRVEYTRKILDEVGIGGERLAMYNMSAAQATRFVEVANEMNERIKELGPNPIKKQKKQESEARSQNSEEKDQKTEVI